MKNTGTLLLEEGLNVLFDKLGIIKTVKFVQLLSSGYGDSVKEIEIRTEKMTRDQALDFIDRIKKKNQPLWGKMKLV